MLEKVLKMQTHSRGLTVVELLVTIMIISIAAMMVVPMFSSAATLQVRSAANMIVADIEYAKSMAIKTGQYYTVSFNTTTDSYRILDQSNVLIPHPVKKGFNYVIDFEDEGLDKVDITAVDFDSTSMVRFDYLGSPFNGGWTPLARGSVTIQAGSVTMRINVEPVTGYISITN